MLRYQRIMRGLQSLLLLLIILGGTGVVQSNERVAQVSPTPARVIIPTSAPLATVGAQPTATATYTPQPEGPVQLQARENAGPVNVRAEPDPDAEILGAIQYGETFTVTGRYFRWIQIRFEPSPSRVAYIFEELVELNGDQSTIPDLTQQELPTSDPAVEATQTMEVILQTPGAVQTLESEEGREIAPPSGASSGDAGNSSPPVEGGSEQSWEPMPTFTYPPNIAAVAPTQIPELEVTLTPDPARLNIAVSDGLAPILPIVILGAAGVIGLLISLMRK